MDRIANAIEAARMTYTEAPAFGQGPIRAALEAIAAFAQVIAGPQR